MRSYKIIKSLFFGNIFQNKVFKEDRKITTLTLERKVELLEEIDKGERSKRQIAEEFGIAPSTLFFKQMNTFNLHILFIRLLHPFQ
jgi:DNA-binding NarL/FixJ family response regulator